MIASGAIALANLADARGRVIDRSTPRSGRPSSCRSRWSTRRPASAGTRWPARTSSCSRGRRAGATRRPRSGRCPRWPTTPRASGPTSTRWRPSRRLAHAVREPDPGPGRAGHRVDRGPGRLGKRLFDDLRGRVNVLQTRPGPAPRRGPCRPGTRRRAGSSSSACCSARRAGRCCCSCSRRAAPGGAAAAGRARPRGPPGRATATSSRGARRRLARDRRRWPRTWTRCAGRSSPSTTRCGTRPTGWTGGPRSWSAPTPSWSSSPTSPRTTCRSRCARWRASPSCSSAATRGSWTSGPTSTSPSRSTAPSGCRC